MHKLLPGQYLTLAQHELSERKLPIAQYYWQPRSVVEQALRHPFQGSEQEAMDQLDALLKDAVALRMEADVPLGAFLSGGFDSSLVVALMQQASPQQVNSFSIGFDDAQFNESEHARAVAKHLQTAHTELFVTAQDALNVIPQLSRIYDEPFSDSSAIPTYLVSQLTRQSVTVALSGDGGDELFGGYGHYATGERLWNLVGGNLPSMLSVDLRHCTRYHQRLSIEWAVCLAKPIWAISCRKLPMCCLISIPMPMLTVALCRIGVICKP